MEEFLVPILLLLLAALLAFLGVRSRRKAMHAYEDDARRYTGSTTMTVIRVDKTEQERWEEREDGSREVMFDTVYLPTYEYTVNGKTYQYSSRQSSLSVQDVGAQVTGYYDPRRHHGGSAQTSPVRRLPVLPWSCDCAGICGGAAVWRTVMAVLKQPFPHNSCNTAAVEHATAAAFSAHLCTLHGITDCYSGHKLPDRSRSRCQRPYR